MRHNWARLKWVCVVCVCVCGCVCVCVCGCVCLYLRVTQGKQQFVGLICRFFPIFVGLCSYLWVFFHSFRSLFIVVRLFSYLCVSFHICWGWDRSKALYGSIKHISYITQYLYYCAIGLFSRSLFIYVALFSHFLRLKYEKSPLWLQVRVIYFFGNKGNLFLENIVILSHNICTIVVPSQMCCCIFTQIILRFINE